MDRRGFGILEVILATTIMALGAVMVTTAVGFAERTASRDLARIDAMEVAHRVVLNYIVDPSSSPMPGDIQTFGSRRYEIHLSEESLVAVSGARASKKKQWKPGGTVTSELRGYGDVNKDARIGAGLVALHVEVYTVAPNGKRYFNLPSAKLTRIFNPLASRDADATMLRHTVRWLN